MIESNDVFPIGRLGKPHGVKGEICFHFNDDIFDRTEAEYLILSVDQILVPFFMEEYRFKNNGTALVKFCDIDSQERAAELTGCEVFFPRELSPEDDEAISWAQLIGYTLYNTETERVAGRIAAIDDSTINILFELDNGILIPASPELITDIDTERQQVNMRLPLGLIDDETEQP